MAASLGWVQRLMTSSIVGLSGQLKRWEVSVIVIPGSDHAGEETVEVPNPEGVRGRLDPLHVPVDDRMPELCIVVPTQSTVLIFEKILTDSQQVIINTSKSQKFTMQKFYVR